MAFLDRFMRVFGEGRLADAARRAELKGDLARAIELWGEAERPDEAARVMVLRGDAEVAPSARMQHYIQAATTAPDGSPVKRDAQKKRALLTVRLAEGGALSAAARHDVLAAAKDLEDLGEPARAAEAYRVAGDHEGEARALAQAGEVDHLEHLLATEQHRERTARRRQESFADIAMMVACGRRREALVTADALAKNGDDRLAIGRADAIRARKVDGTIVRVRLAGKPMAIVLGDDVTIGRTEGSLLIPSHAVSRRHVRIAREGDAVVVSDLGSRNGTRIRGIPISGSIPVGDGVDLSLGKDVSLRVAPADELPGAIAIDTGGRRFIAPLGKAALAPFGWRLERTGHAGSAIDPAWVELVSDVGSAFLGDVAVVERTTLLVGDAIASQRGGPAVLEIVGPGA